MEIDEILRLLLSIVGGGAIIRAGIGFVIRKNNADLDEAIHSRKIQHDRIEELTHRVNLAERERDESKAKEKIVEEKLKVLTDQGDDFQRQLEESNRILKGIQHENTRLTSEIASMHLELSNAKLERDNAATRLLEKNTELEKERAEKTAILNQFNGFREALSFMNVLVEKKAELREITSNG